MIHRWTFTINGPKASSQIYYFPTAFSDLLITIRNSDASDNQMVSVEEYLGSLKLWSGNVPVTPNGVVLYNSNPKGSHLQIQFPNGIKGNIYFDCRGET